MCSLPKTAALRARRREAGFTYLFVLAAVAILGIGLAAASEVWVTTAQSGKRAQLDWAGHQFVRAIGSYYQATPGAIKMYPPTLQDLILDPRYVTVRRHLREMYPNPFTGVADWQPVTTPDGRVRGVRADLPQSAGGASVEFVCGLASNS